MNIYQSNINTIKTEFSRCIPGYKIGCHEYFISSNKKPLYIQFPPCKVVTLNKCTMFTMFSAIDNSIHKFFIDLELLRKKIIRDIEKKNKNIIISWSSPIYNNINDNKIPFHTYIDTQLKIYNQSKELVNSDINLLNQNYIDSIIEIEKVQLKSSYLLENNKKYVGTIIFKIVQIRIPHSFDHSKTNLIKNTLHIGTTKPPLSSQQTKGTFGSHPLYAKYFKMLRHGIPEQAVKQKLIMENIPIILLEYSETDVIPDNMKQDIPKPDTIVLQLQKKNLQETAKLVKNKDDKLRKTTHGITLSDILNKITRLRKTGFMNIRF